MYIEEVKTSEQEKQFYQLPFTIYKDCKEWIAPLGKDIKKVFNVDKNKAFKFGECVRYLLLDNEKKCIGRIAAFTNKKYKNKGDTRKIGGIGFFECIHYQEAANMLFDIAKKWLQEKNMEAMDGPINFGERDAWWGLLTEGFHAPLYQMNYHLPYYKTLFEQYGFCTFFEQHCYGREIASFKNEKMEERHAMVQKNYPNIHIRVIEKNNLRKYAEDFVTIYNKAWGGHGGLKQLSVREVWATFNSMKAILDEQICLFAYDQEEPIGMFINIPGLNDFFKHFNGKLGWWQKLQLLYMLHFHQSTHLVGIIFGIVPEWQGKGIDNYFVIELQKKILQKKLKYQFFEMQWIGDFNPKMINLAKHLGTLLTRKLITYRYNFDGSEVKRHPIL